MKHRPKMLYWILIALLLISTIIVSLGYYFSSPGYSGPVSDHFNGKRFINESGVRAKNFLDIIKWAVNRNEGEWKDETSNHSYGEKPVESVSDSIHVTFINHATFLIQAEGQNILTDPIYSKRASPFSFMGPERMRLPGIRFEDLPEIQLILISHNHYDHLDLSTIKKLHEKYAPLFVVPLGVKKFLESKGITNVVELDWWQEKKLEGVTISSVPAQHFSSRGLFDKDKTLWSGYIIQTNSGNIYFAGDTGYGEFFKQIGQRHQVKLGLLPIGAYEPRWVMKDIHMNPAEAVQAYKDIGAESALGMHFGTFPLADDGQAESVMDLEEILRMPENKDIDFRVIKEGERVVIK